MRAVRLIMVLLPILWLVPAGRAWSGTIKGRVNCGARCQDFVIYLRGVPGDYSGDGKVVVLDEKDKTFIPHVMPVLKGTTLRMKNSDPFLHNIHAYVDKKTVFNRALPPIKNLTLDHVLKVAATHVMLCDIHTEMSAYVVALENPFYAQPDAKGTYEIRDVPEGTYTLVSLDPEEKEVREKKVSATGASVTIDF